MEGKLKKDEKLKEILEVKLEEKIEKEGKLLEDVGGVGWLGQVEGDVGGKGGGKVGGEMKVSREDDVLVLSEEVYLFWMRWWWLDDRGRVT